jgi:hypothetical protein
MSNLTARYSIYSTDGIAYDTEISQRIFSEWIGILSLVEEMVAENRKTVDIGAKDYVRREK